MDNMPRQIYLRSSNRASPPSMMTSTTTSINNTTTLWQIFYPLFTLLLPSFILRLFIEEKYIEAWREKVALVIIIGGMCCVMGLLTIGMNRWVCRGGSHLVYDDIITSYDSKGNFIKSPYFREGKDKIPHKYTFFNGKSYRMEDINNKSLHNKVVHNLHPIESNNCKYKTKGMYDSRDVYSDGPIYFGAAAIKQFGFVRIGDSLYKPENLNKLNVANKSDGVSFDEVFENKNLIGDNKSYKCTLDRCYVGKVRIKSWGCLCADLILYISTVCIFTLLIVKFVLAGIYTFYSKRKDRVLKRKYYSLVGVSGINELESRLNHSTPKLDGRKYMTSELKSKKQSWNFSTYGNRLNSNSKELSQLVPPTITLVTVYSEDKEGMRLTMDSLYNQVYENHVVMIVCDGHVSGINNNKDDKYKSKSKKKEEEDKENKQKEETTTPNILLSLMGKILYIHNPSPYISIGEPPLRTNNATVIGALYEPLSPFKDPLRCIIIIKDGNSSESTSSKPGNRGKRDSQIILLSFLQKIFYGDRLTSLDVNILYTLKFFNFDIYKLNFISMIDADTIVQKRSVLSFALTYYGNPTVIGICGETKILNKNKSFITMCQVFEYFISHHLIKSFESVFGGVTCLPGCFCTYRVYSKVGTERILPIICNSIIVDEYSVSHLYTLHDKNLYSLGEDRFLTTLILKTFHRYRLIFIPSAVSLTEVPSKVFILFSQRRRWINSTVHNLMELISVPNLCGTFCCSMQFVALFDLVGTLVLPVAVFFTGILILNSILIAPAWIPLLMLALIFGLPSTMVFLINFDVSLFFYLIVYIFSLPLWNFMLPIYAFWHFDDFSWGETRKVREIKVENEEREEIIEETVRLEKCEDVMRDVYKK